MRVNKEKNKELVEKYPFLMPHNRWTDHIPEDYDYSYTELDAMPDGWRKAFGERMCEEIREELVRADYLHGYRIAISKRNMELSGGTTSAVQSGCSMRLSPNMRKCPRELVSDAGTCDKILLAGSAPIVTLVQMKSDDTRDSFLLMNGSVEVKMM